MNLPSASGLRQEFRRPADLSRLGQWLVLSALLHLLLLVSFAEVDWAPDGANGLGNSGALTVRLRLRWSKPADAPALQGSDDRVSPVAPPNPPVRGPARPAASAPDPMPRIAAEPLPVIEAPALVPPPLVASAPLPEPPPLPRVVAEPLPRTETPTMQALPPEAVLLKEPPPLPRVEAAPLPRLETPTMRTLPPETAPLAEPPPLPRIDAVPIMPVAPSPLPAMRPAPQAVAPLVEPPPPSAVPPSAVPPAGPPTASSASPGAAPSSAAAAPGVASTAPGPDRLDFGPRRVVDPDLAALVGEAAPTTPTPPAPAPGLDLDATRALARNLHRAPAPPSRRALDLSAPKPEAESTLGRAIGKAAQPDCRLAYAGLGLLGVPFLLFDTVTDTGCRW